MQLNTQTFCMYKSYVSIKLFHLTSYFFAFYTPFQHHAMDSKCSSSLYPPQRSQSYGTKYSILHIRNLCNKMFPKSVCKEKLTCTVHQLMPFSCFIYSMLLEHFSTSAHCICLEFNTVTHYFLLFMYLGGHLTLFQAAESLGLAFSKMLNYR